MPVGSGEISATDIRFCIGLSLAGDSGSTVVLFGSAAETVVLSTEVYSLTGQTPSGEVEGFSDSDDSGSGSIVALLGPAIE